MVDVSDATFEQEVLELSERIPVVVDLWAEWCQPCKTLGPILEKVIGETNGQVALAKVDTDANPGLSQAFQVQSIPAVHAVYQRKVVASFVGAQPESAVRKFVEGLTPSEEELEFLALLEAGDEESLRKALELVPGDPEAIVKLAEIEVSDGRFEDALATLNKVPESPETRRVAALARTGSEPEHMSDPDGPLANVEVTLAELLPRVKEDEDARQQYIDLLELMGNEDPRTGPARKELSRKLF